MAESSTSHFGRSSASSAGPGRLSSVNGSFSSAARIAAIFSAAMAIMMPTRPPAVEIRDRRLSGRRRAGALDGSCAAVFSSPVEALQALYRYVPYVYSYVRKYLRVL